MNGPELRALLASGPLLADGGLGTAMVERGASLEGCFEELNETAAETVEEIHRAFVAAGARLLLANTFGANRFALAKFGLQHRVAELNRRGVEIARRAATTGVLVGGSIGPLRVHLAPYGRVRPQQALEAYAEQAAALAEAGVDLILIETQSDLKEMEQALAAVRSVCDLACGVSATFTRDDRTLLGSTPEQVARRLVELGADVVGVNCSEGPAQVLRIVNAMRPHAGDTPVSAMPNAGGPSRVGERILYPAHPEYLGDYARAFLASGARLVGGCCGTGPEHIAAMARALDEPLQMPLELLPAPEGDDRQDHRPAPTRLKERLAEGRFVIAVEMDPPKGFSVARLLAGAETLADAGADAIYVSDSSRARLRMSAWAACRLIQEHAGVETVLGFPTRGRNLLRVQGDLLGTHALGIRNLFVVMGDPTAIGDFPQANDASDVAPTGLIGLVTKSFNAGVDQSGASIGEPTSFVVGCALNLNAADVDRECRLLRRKIEAGADFALSQPVFSLDVLRTFRKTYEERFGRLELPVLVGVAPLLNARNAEYLHNEVPGISIPTEIRERMRSAGEDGGPAEGLRIAIELGREIRAESAGVYITPPFRRYDLAAEVVEAVRAG